MSSTSVATAAPPGTTLTGPTFPATRCSSCTNAYPSGCWSLRPSATGVSRMSWACRPALGAGGPWVITLRFEPTPRSWPCTSGEPGSVVRCPRSDRHLVFPRPLTSSSLPPCHHSVERSQGCTSGGEAARTARSGPARRLTLIVRLTVRIGTIPFRRFDRVFLATFFPPCLARRVRPTAGCLGLPGVQ